MSDICIPRKQENACKADFLSWLSRKGVTDTNSAVIAKVSRVDVCGIAGAVPNLLLGQVSSGYITDTQGDN